MTKISLILFIFTTSIFANMLQDAIDKAPSGSTLKLSSGVYKGNILINKPITIIGKEPNVIIKGDNNSSVITINSSYVTLKNLTISSSGSRLRELDSAIVINNADYCEINGCKIVDSLYGIFMNMVNHSSLQNNYITSKKTDISLRGNALKLYYSNHNVIKDNIIESSRDSTLTYSNNNTIKNNRFSDNRFALHISLSDKNILQENRFNYNSVGIMIMGAKDTTLTNNQIHSCTGAAGIGVVLKGVSNLVFEKNSVKYNAKGIYIDTKYNEVDIQRHIKNNEISYNKEAINFQGLIKNNEIINNNFVGNIDDIVKSSRGALTRFNIIEYNYWDRYTGFDRDNDGTGDNQHKIYQYADQLWHYNNKVKFFYASPAMSLLNFLSNLAPFVEPVLIIQDTKPAINYLSL